MKSDGIPKTHENSMPPNWEDISTASSLKYSRVIRIEIRQRKIKRSVDGLNSSDALACDPPRGRVGGFSRVAVYTIPETSSPSLGSPVFSKTFGVASAARDTDIARRLDDSSRGFAGRKAANFRAARPIVRLPMETLTPLSPVPFLFVKQHRKLDAMRWRWRIVADR